MARREALSVAEEVRLPAPTGAGREKGERLEERRGGGGGQAVLVARQRKRPEMS